LEVSTREDLGLSPEDVAVLTTALTAESDVKAGYGLQSKGRLGQMVISGS
jgi:hypothetical protein